MKTSVLLRIFAPHFIVSVLCADGAAAQSIPEGGENLLAIENYAADASFYSNSTAGGTVASRTLVDVSGQTFEQAVRIDVMNPTGQPWSSAMSGASGRAVEDGDVVLLHFFMRTIVTTSESGAAKCHVYVEGPAPNYTKSISQDVFAGTEWVEWFLPFTVQGSFSAGDFGVKFGFGSSERPETFEIGGVEALYYGESRTLDEMPRTSFQYDGRATDAPWRVAAAARIEQHRKSGYEVSVVNAAGLSVSGAEVRVKLKQHAFQFGTAFPSRLVMNNTTFREKLLELFNAGGTENDLKWPPWIGEWGGDFNQPQTLAALELLDEAGFNLRGHVLVWPSARNLPNSVTPLLAAQDPVVLDRVIEHIEDVVVPTRDYLDEWDVINEPFDNHLLMDLFGDDIMIEWFEAAREHHPTARLYLNDYGIIAAGGTNTAHQDHFEDTLRFLVDGGAPIGGIGIQGHFSASPTGITKAWSLLERYADAFPDLAIKITEFDVDTDDEELQADYTRDFLTLFFSHPQTIGFQFWGFWEGAHWRPRAAMYRENWEEKPNGLAYRQLVHETWQTDEIHTSGSDGRARGRGFLGTYDVEVTFGGTTYTETFLIESDGGEVEVVVEADVASRAPELLQEPFGVTVAPGEPATLAFDAPADPAPTITWYKNGAALTAEGDKLEITATSAQDEGVYHAVIANDLGTTRTRDVMIGVRAPENRSERFANISTRGEVLTGGEIMIAGFVIDGDGSKDVVIRGIGPRLGALGVMDPLADPRLEILTAGVNPMPVAENDDWDASLGTVFDQLGAFGLEDDEKSAALRLQLEPGGYTAQFTGVGGATGVGIIEVYDAATGGPVRMVNISTRGVVGSAEAVLIAGFVIDGEVPQRVLIRGIGPTLADFGVEGALADSTVKLFETVPGGESREIAFNDDWSVGLGGAAISAAADDVGAFQLAATSLDAALLVFLEPGAYTVHVAGRDDATGVALAEIYRVL